MPTLQNMGFAILNGTIKDWLPLFEAWAVEVWNLINLMYVEISVTAEIMRDAGFWFE